MQFTSVLNQAAVLFILLIVGFILKKIKIITDEFGKDLSQLILTITLPALIITSMNYEFSKEMFNNSVLILLFGILAYIFMIIVAMIFTKLLHTKEPQKSIYKFIIIFSNTGFMGYPILDSIFGEIGVFYGAIFNLLFNILLWTLGVILVSPVDERKINLKTLINPGVISVVTGFTLFLLSIDIPYVIYQPLKLIGNTTTPLAMMLVGSLLGDAKFREVFSNYRLIIIAGLRLLIIPVALLLILSLFNLPEIVTITLVIVCGMPSAANAAIFARRYDSDYLLASQGVFLTTL